MDFSYLCLVKKRKKIKNVYKYGDFDEIYKTIKAYMVMAVNTEKQIASYVPNKHLAETFLDVLKACECESMHPRAFHNIKIEHGGANSVREDRLHLYTLKEDGLYYRTEKYRMSFIDIINNYFNIERLNVEGVFEILNVYYTLRDKDDNIRNDLKLIHRYIPQKYYMVYRVGDLLKSSRMMINGEKYSYSKKYIDQLDDNEKLLYKRNLKIRQIRRKIKKATII